MDLLLFDSVFDYFTDSTSIFVYSDEGSTESTRCPITGRQWATAGVPVRNDRVHTVSRFPANTSFPFLNSRVKMYFRFECTALNSTQGASPRLAAQVLLYPPHLLAPQMVVM